MPDELVHSVELAHDYARRVVAGDQVAGKWVRLACQQHLAALDDTAWPYVFDAEDAQWVLDFLGRCRHSKGKWAREPLVLEPWQQFIVANLYGWKRPDGFRRYRVGYIEIARKNGKTTKCAGLGLYHLIGDGEQGAEVYSAATKQDQAKITWDAASAMVARSPELRARIVAMKSTLTLVYHASSSSFKPLGADAHTLDGLNPSAAIIDELHAHRNGDVYNVIDSGTGAREQPMLIVTTTAGSDLASFCGERHKYVCDVLEGKVEDPEVFGYVATLDADDEWDDPAVWIKANPNLGVSVYEEDLAAKINAAKQSPSLQNEVKRKRLNLWTQAKTRFLRADRWAQCAGALAPAELEALNRGRRCWAGLDLASTTDIAAFVWAWLPEDEEAGQWDIGARFWIPADGLEERELSAGVPYSSWVADGFLQTTSGDVIDYREVVETVLEVASENELVSVRFDRWGAQAISNELTEKGVTMVEFGQGYASMSPPTKELERMVLARMFRHGGHPVLSWMAENLEVATDPAGNLKPVKPGHKMSHKKIDGMVALIMAISGVLSPSEEEGGPSVYESRGVRTL